MVRKPTRVLAFDFGASSGRAILGTFIDGKLNYEEIHRFENNPIPYKNHLCWDFPTLWAEVKTGLRKAEEKGGFDSIGVDTWGVDYGLLDANDHLLDLPVHYRDDRTTGVVNKVYERLSARYLYTYTGNQVMPINTLFQLASSPETLQKAQTLLFIPDLFGFMLTGKKYCERSIASTSQMLDPLSETWADVVLEAVQIPDWLVCELIPSGTVVGPVRPELREELHIPESVKVVAVAGHDTQCAVAAMPTNDTEVAFISCGTWSLFGTELKNPILTEHSRKLELTNEIGANGKINYLKNIIGLWLIQESRREYRRQGTEYSYAELEKLALETAPFGSMIDPDAPEFTPLGNIPARIQRFCRASEQTPPKTVGETMRCIYESLALKYRYTLEQIQQATGKKFKAIHMLGGGAKDRLLCQMTADSCGIPVVAGPVEATALGNILIQLVALGEIENLEQGRNLVRTMTELKTYHPQDIPAWEEAYRRYQTLLETK